MNGRPTRPGRCFEGGNDSDCVLSSAFPIESLELTSGENSWLLATCFGEPLELADSSSGRLSRSVWSTAISERNGHMRIGRIFA